MREACSRHPQVPGEFGVTTHYLNSNNWRDTVRVDQTFGPLCSACRMEFINWVCTKAEGD